MSRQRVAEWDAQDSAEAERLAKEKAEQEEEEDRQLAFEEAAALAAISAAIAEKRRQILESRTGKGKEKEVVVATATTKGNTTKVCLHVLQQTFIDTDATLADRDGTTCRLGKIRNNGYNCGKFNASLF